VEGPAIDSIRGYYKQISVGKTVLMLGAGTQFGRITKDIFKLDENGMRWENITEWKNNDYIFGDLHSFQPCFTVVNDRYVHAIGGTHGRFSNDQPYPNMRHFMLDTMDTVGWVELAPRTVFSLGHACLVGKDGAGREGIFVTGGITSGCPGHGYMNFTRVVEFFDLATKSWDKLEPLVAERGFHVMGVIDNKPAVMGGVMACGPEYRLDIELYQDGQWTLIDNTLSQEIHGYTQFASTVQISDNKFSC